MGKADLWVREGRPRWFIQMGENIEKLNLVNALHRIRQHMQSDEGTGGCLFAFSFLLLSIPELVFGCSSFFFTFTFTFTFNGYLSGW